MVIPKGILISTQYANNLLLNGLNMIDGKGYCANLMSFVREVYGNNEKALSEVDLLRLRGCRVEVLVYPEYWVIYPVE